MTEDKVTRFAAELVDSAAAEGARSSRSARQQLDHWVRIGRAVSSATSASRSRIDAAFSGDLQTVDLTHFEGVAFNAEVGASIEESLASTHYGRVLAREGIATVALDESGRLVRYAPDGSATPLRAG